MAKTSLKKISKLMRNLDYCMMTTTSTAGMSVSRPMSNNGDVKYDGNSYFFSWEGSRVVSDLKKNSKVNLSFQGRKKLFVSVSGTARLVHDKKTFKEHWVKELKNWFKDGIDTEGLVMIHVKAARIKLWQAEDEYEAKS